MKRLSKLSQECIANNGLCCENRTPPILLPNERKLIKGKASKEFTFGKEIAMPKGLCCFFKEPFCSVYLKRPVDCRTYPVSVDFENGKTVYLIDRNCPAVKKGLVSKRFIQKAIKLWTQANPTQKWISEYINRDNQANYDWISVEEYQRR